MGCIFKIISVVAQTRVVASVTSLDLDGTHQGAHCRGRAKTPGCSHLLSLLSLIITITKDGALGARDLRDASPASRPPGEQPHTHPAETSANTQGHTASEGPIGIQAFPAEPDLALWLSQRLHWTFS